VFRWRVAIVLSNLNPDIWLSPLMVLGTQWYILFNVIAGASTMPKELRDAAENFGVHGWLWWRKVALPAVFPTTSPAPSLHPAAPGTLPCGRSRELGHSHMHAHGLGAYIADAVSSGDFRRVVLGTAVMSFFVVVVNRILWRPLYWYAERKFRLT
jgi:NitT/TauT family transport system permease protein